MNAACGIEPSVGTVDHENVRAEGLDRRSLNGQVRTAMMYRVPSRWTCAASPVIAQDRVEGWERGVARSGQVR